MKKSFLKLFLLLIVLVSSYSSGQENELNAIDKLLFNGNYSVAKLKLEKRISNDSLNAETFYKLGLACQGLYQNAKALKAFSKACRFDSTNTNYLISLGNCYYNLGYLDNAEKVYLTVIKKDSIKTSAAFKLADVYIDGMKYRKAAEIYKQLLNADSANSFLYKKLGFCAMKTDSLKLAIKYYHNALLYNNEDINTAVQMSAILFKLEEMDSALQYVNMGLQVLPEEPNFNKLKADILFSMGNSKEAKDCYLKIISHGDSSAQVYQKLGFCYYFIAAAKDSFISNDIYMEKFSNYYKALDAFEKSYYKEKDNRVTTYYAGIISDKVGYFDKAIFYYNEAIKLLVSDNAGDIYTNLGRICHASGHYYEAIDAYKKAFFYNPLQKDLLFYIATIYEDFLKNYPDALNYYQTFIKESGSQSNGLTEASKEKIKALKKK